MKLLCTVLLFFSFISWSRATSINDNELIALISDKSAGDDLQRIAAIERAGDEGKTSTTGALMAIASDPTEARGARYRAMIALGKLRSEAALPLFKSIIEEMVRVSKLGQQSSWGLDTYIGTAFSALGNMGTAKAKLILRESFEVRKQMNLDRVQLECLIRAAGQLQIEEAIVGLEEILFDPNDFVVKSSAIWALSKIATREARDVLGRFGTRHTQYKELTRTALELFVRLSTVSDANAPSCNSELLP